MISTTDRYGMKLSLISNSHTDHPSSTDRPLEVLIGSSFVGVLAHVEGSRWLIQALFFESPELFQIKRWSFKRRWWCGRLNKTHSYIFLLTKSRIETLDPTPHAREEEHFFCFSCMEAQPTLNFSCSNSQVSHAKITTNLAQNWSLLKDGIPWKIRRRKR